MQNWDVKAPIHVFFFLGYMSINFGWVSCWQKVSISYIIIHIYIHIPNKFSLCSFACRLSWFSPQQHGMYMRLIFVYLFASICIIYLNHFLSFFINWCKLNHSHYIIIPVPCFFPTLYGTIVILFYRVDGFCGLLATSSLEGAPLQLMKVP